MYNGKTIRCGTPHVEEFIGYENTKDVFIQMLKYIYHNGIDLVSERGQKYKEAMSPVVMTIVDPSISKTEDLIDEHIIKYFPTSFLEKYAIVLNTRHAKCSIKLYTDF